MISAHFPLEVFGIRINGGGRDTRCFWASFIGVRQMWLRNILTRNFINSLFFGCRCPLYWIICLKFPVLVLTLFLSLFLSLFLFLFYRAISADIGSEPFRAMLTFGFLHDDLEFRFFDGFFHYQTVDYTVMYTHTLHNRVERIS